MTTVQVGREGDRGSRHGPDTRQTHGVVPLRPGGQPGKQSTHPRSGEPGPKAPRMKGIMIRTTGFQGRRPTRRSSVVCFCPGPQLSPRSADGGSLLCTDTAPGALKPSARLTDSSLQLYRPGAVVHRCGNKGTETELRAPGGTRAQALGWDRPQGGCPWASLHCATRLGHKVKKVPVPRGTGLSQPALPARPAQAQGSGGREEARAGLGRVAGWRAGPVGRGLPQAVPSTPLARWPPYLCD